MRIPATLWFAWLILAVQVGNLRAQRVNRRWPLCLLRVLSVPAVRLPRSPQTKIPLVNGAVRAASPPVNAWPAQRAHK